MIRRVAASCALLVLLLLAHWLAPVSDVPAAVAPTALLSFGFLILAAWTAGDLAETFGLSRITAYLLTGLVVGPGAIGLIDAQLLGPILYFERGATPLPVTVMAIGLMGLRAGTAIRLDTVRDCGVGGLAFGVSSVVLTGLFGALAGLVWTLFAGADPLLAVAVGIVAIGAAPGAVVGVLDETGSRGQIGQLALATAAVREFITPLLVATLLLWQGAGPSEVLRAAPWVAVLVGAAAGAALLGVRWANARDTPVLTVSMVFGIGLVFAAASPFGPMLLLLVAGATATNAHHRLGAGVTTALGSFAAPLYVFFFAILGASLPLTAHAIGLGLLLAGGRLAGLLVSGLAGRRLVDSRCPPALLGLSGLSQAGSSVAAVYLLIDDPTLRAGALTGILLSELAGPYALTRLLQRVGEYVAPGSALPEPELTPFEKLVEAGATLPEVPETLDPAIAAGLARLRLEMQAQMDQLSDALGEALATGPFAYLAGLRAPAEGAPDTSRPPVVREWLERTTHYSGQSIVVDAVPPAMEKVLAQLEEQVAGLRPVSVPETDLDRRARRTDTRSARARKLVLRGLASLGLRRRARRIIRLEDLARHHLTSPLPNQLVPIVHLAMRGAVLPLTEVDRRVRDETGLRPPDEAAVDGLRELGDDVLARARLLFGDAIAAMYRDAAVAGTPSLPDRAISPVRRADLERAGRRRLKEAGDQWRDLAEGRAGLLIARLALDSVSEPIRAAWDDGAVATQRQVQEMLVEPLRHMSAEADQALKALPEIIRVGQGGETGDEGATAAAVAEALLRLRDRLLIGPEAMIRDLDARRNRGELRSLFAPLQTRLGHALVGLPESLDVPTERRPLPVEGLAPQSEDTALTRLSIRDVARVALVHEAAVNLMGVTEQLNRLVQQARGTLGHAAQVLRFHLDAAIAELNDAASERPAELAREFAIGGLERVASRLADELASAQEAAGGLAERVGAEGEASIARAHRLLLEEEPAAAERFAARRRPESPPVPESLATPPRRVSARLSPLMGLLSRPIAPESVEEPGYAHTRAGTCTLAHTARLGLPETYRRLFSFRPLELDDFFVGRAAEMGALRLAVERWQEGSPTAVLLTGVRGSGRTSLVERLRRGLPPGMRSVRCHIRGRASSERALIRELARSVGLEKLDSTRRLVEHLVTQIEPMVIVVEPLGRLHLRAPNGLSALRCLRRLISDTAHRVLWVVVTDPDSIRAMDALVPVTTVFTDVIEVPPLNEHQLEALIAARNHAGGYSLRFRAPGHRVPRAAGESEADLRARYFETLAQRSGGLPLLAIFEWLRSLRLDSAETTLVVETPVALDLAHVDGLSDDDLLLLAQVHVHAGLTATEVPRIASLAGEGAAASIRRLAWRSFLDTIEGDRFVMNPVIWPQIRKALARRGIL